MNSRYESTMSALRAEARQQGLRPATLEPLFEKFMLIVENYAALEKSTLGSVPLQFPAHLLQNDPGNVEDPVEHGLRLAARERERLDLGHGAVHDISSLIETQGLKVVELPIPPESGLLGLFVFDASFGPAILIDARRPRLERDYALAHEYGHFLADNDPYRVQVCLRSLKENETFSEIRAHAFAGALLVPEEDLESYLRASNITKGEPFPPELLGHLRTYFEADDRAIIGRLLASGWVERGEIARLMEETRVDGPLEPVVEGSSLSPRFVGLAVIARKDGRLTLAEFARTLDVDEATARRIESSFSARGEGESHGDSAD
jgi:Zn-dependent peptidase ImmA (M78 family)